MINVGVKIMPKDSQIDSKQARETILIRFIPCTPPPNVTNGCICGNNARPFASINTIPSLRFLIYLFFVNGRNEYDNATRLLVFSVSKIRKHDSYSSASNCAKCCINFN